jgi:hypothetical protein
MVDEKYILVNEQHNTIGTMGKNTCTFICSVLYGVLIGYLIENINRGLLHRALSALTFRSCGGVCHRAALCFGEDYLPGHVDKHLRSAPTG